MNTIEKSFSLMELPQIAKDLLEETSGHKVFTFSGELGAGKTTLISKLCKQLNVADIVSSPTFTIVQEYKSGDNQSIFHMDLYRIKGDEDAVHSGLTDYISGDNFCFVEWPENAPHIFPPDTINISLEIIDTKHRKMIIQLP